VVNAYLLVLAAFVVSAGRLGDILGRRRVFLIGMTAFAGGSVVAGLAGTEEVLVAGRVLQGLGGAALLGLSLAIVSTVFPGDERARALGIWAGVGVITVGLGLAAIVIALVEGKAWGWTSAATLRVFAGWCRAPRRVLVGEVDPPVRGLVPLGTGSSGCSGSAAS
jgi:MFS family permease